MVTAITEKHINLISESGKSVKRWDLADHSSRHFDYGIALTPLQASHRHPEIVIAYQNSGSRQSHHALFIKSSHRPALKPGFTRKIKPNY